MHLPPAPSTRLCLTFTCLRMRVVSPWICSSCRASQAQSLATTQRTLVGGKRHFRSATPLRVGQAKEQKDEEREKEQGAMSRRLSEMAEETMDTGSKSDRKMMQDVGFSEDLKKQLEERIAQSAFQAENQQAISVANLPVRKVDIYTHGQF